MNLHPIWKLSEVFEETEESMSFTQSHETQATLKECLRELTQAVGTYDYEVTGDRLVVRDHGKRIVIDLIYEGDRRLGSLDLPMTRIDYEFVGYTKDEMGKFMERISEHMMRAGGG